MHELFVIRRLHDDRDALSGKVSEQAVDLRLGLHVDSAGGIEQQQAARTERQPFGKQHLLLVATRQRHDGVRELAIGQFEAFEKDEAASVQRYPVAVKTDASKPHVV